MMAAGFRSACELEVAIRSAFTSADEDEASSTLTPLFDTTFLALRSLSLVSFYGT